MMKFFTSVFITLLSMVSLGAEETTEERPSLSTPDYVTYVQLPDLLERGFVFVDLGLSKQEMSILDQLQVTENLEYSRFGNLPLLKDELPLFLKEIGNSDPALITQITQMIERVASLVITASGKETAWVCLRASTPNNEFDIPRWHMDGPYYLPHFMPQFKFATALKGNGTLLYPLTTELRALYRETLQKVIDANQGQGYLDLSQESRSVLSQIFDHAQAVSPKQGQGVFFVVAHDAVAALHSEPKIDTPRLFMSILPANEKEIKQLYDAWHKK